MSNDNSFILRKSEGVGWGNELKTDFVNLAVIPNGYHLTKNKQGEEELFLQLPSGATVTLNKEEAAQVWAWIRAHAAGARQKAT